MKRARIPIQQEVPQQFADRLRQMRDVRDPQLNAVLAAARAAGWRTATLAGVLDMKPAAVSKRIERAADPVEIEIPQPTRVQAMMDGRRLPDDVLDRLREQHRVASRVNGALPADHPDRQVSQEFSEALARLIQDQGFTPYYLARALGVTHRAITSRLERHGFRRPCPSVVGTSSGSYSNRKVGDLLDSDPRLTNDEADQLRQMYDQVRAAGRASDLRRPGHPLKQLSDELGDALQNYLEEGYPLKHLAQELGARPDALRRRLARHHGDLSPAERG